MINKIMNKIVLTITCLVFSIFSYAQEVKKIETMKDIYDVHSRMKDVKSVYVSPAMFKMLGKLPEVVDDIDISPAVSSLSGMYMLETSKFANSISSSVDSVAAKQNYSLLLSINDEEDRIKVYAISNGDIVTNLVVFIEEEKSCNFVYVEANISMDALISIAASSGNTKYFK